MAPKGLYEQDEESGVEKFGEEFAMPGTEELKSLEAWGHRHPNILNAGRCSHFVPSTVPEEEREEFAGALAEKDPIVDRYRILAEDAPLKGED